MYSIRKMEINAQIKKSNCLRTFFGLAELPDTDCNKFRLKSVSYLFGIRINIKKIILAQRIIVNIIFLLITKLLSQKLITSVILFCKV